MQQKSQNSINAAGLWELPGGKIPYSDEELVFRAKHGLPTNRSSRDAIIQELCEEKNIYIQDFVDEHPEELVYVGVFEYSYYMKSKDITREVSQDLFSINLDDSFLNDISKEGEIDDNLSDFAWFEFQELYLMGDKIAENSRIYSEYSITKLTNRYKLAKKEYAIIRR
jgi:8-oxo-dGTP pyrophosphatase MutT (NUDIX family)